MDSVVSNLRGEGRTDSRGQFTLDLKARARKTAIFLVQHPALYMAKLVQAAVAAGAEQVDIGARGDWCEMSFVPQALAGEELRTLADALDTGQATRLQHFEQALVLLSAAEISSFFLTLNAENTYFSVVSQAGRWTCEVRISDESAKSCRFVLERLSTRWWKPLARSARDQQWRDFLLQRLRLCPIPCLWNSERLNLGDGESWAWDKHFKRYHQTGALSKVARFLDEATDPSQSPRGPIYRWGTAFTRLAEPSQGGFALASPAPGRATRFRDMHVTTPDRSHYLPEVHKADLKPSPKPVFYEFKGRNAKSLAFHVKTWLHELSGVMVGCCLAPGVFSVHCQVWAVKIPETALLPAFQTRHFVTGLFTDQLWIEQPSLRARSFCAQTVKSEGPALALPVKDGLLLDPVELSAAPGTLVILAYDGLCDMGHLKAVADADFHAQVDRCWPN